MHLPLHEAETGQLARAAQAPAAAARDGAVNGARNGGRGVVNARVLRVVDLDLGVSELVQGGVLAAAGGDGGLCERITLRVSQPELKKDHSLNGRMKADCDTTRGQKGT